MNTTVSVSKETIDKLKNILELFNDSKKMKVTKNVLVSELIEEFLDDKDLENKLKELLLKKMGM